MNWVFSVKQLSPTAVSSKSPLDCLPCIATYPTFVYVPPVYVHMATGLICDVVQASSMHQLSWTVRSVFLFSTTLSEGRRNQNCPGSVECWLSLLLLLLLLLIQYCTSLLRSVLFLAQEWLGAMCAYVHKANWLTLTFHMSSDYLTHFHTK